MIREALELLTRPLRRRRWRRRRERIIAWVPPVIDLNYNPLADHDSVCCGGPLSPPEIPCTWEERDHADIKQDAHRWVESKLAPWVAAHKKAETFLGRFKKEVVGPDDDDDDDEEDMSPVWGEPKETRDARRRAKLHQALRRKIPRAWEEGA